MESPPREDGGGGAGGQGVVLLGLGRPQEAYSNGWFKILDTFYRNYFRVVSWHQKYSEPWSEQ